MENNYFIIIGLYCLFCFIIYFSSIPLSKLYIPYFKTLDSTNRLLWYQRAISTVHATIMFSLTVYYWLVKNPTWKLITTSDGQYESFTICIMLGYLLFDCIHDTYYGWSFDMFLHHGVGATSHILTLAYFNKAAMYICMIVYLAEGSTPFLSISWIMNQVKLKDTLLFKIASTLLIVNFFVFRVVMSPVCFYVLIQSKDSWGDSDAEKYLFYGNTVVIAFFGLLNQFWFYKLIKIALGIKNNKPEKQKGKTG